MPALMVYYLKDNATGLVNRSGNNGELGAFVDEH